MLKRLKFNTVLYVTVFVLSLSSGSNASVISGSAGRGKEIFGQKCSVCHTIGRGRKVGPDLHGVTARRETAWLVVWITNPQKMIKSGDFIANVLLKEHNDIQMPTIGLSEEKIFDVLSYLESQKDLKIVHEEILPGEKKGNAEIVFVSGTYFRFFEDARGKRHAPFYERVDLEFRNKERNMGFYSSGWLRYDLRSAEVGEKENDELTYAFLRYSPPAISGLLFNIGRHFVFEGIASEQMDGISSRWEITPSTGFSLFGGIPVEAEFDGKRGDLIYGGRLFQRIEKKAELGVSFLMEDNSSSHYRKEAGVDIWFLPVKDIEFQGHSSFNNIKGGWMEHSYYLRIFPLKRLIVSGLLVYTDYDNTFSARTFNAFSPDFAGKGEKMTKTGASAEYIIDKNIRLSLDFAGYEYERSGNARHYGAKITADLFGVLSGFSIHRMEGAAERLRYTELRAYAKKIFKKATFSMDALNLHYDKAFNGLSNAYSVNGNVGYKVNDSLTAGADIEYIKSPDFNHNTTVLLKLVYAFKKELYDDRK